MTTGYWDARFREANDHHQRQNDLITGDFMIGANEREKFVDALCGRAIIEIGCGTGDLIAAVATEFEPDYALGTDLSREAILRAGERFPRVSFGRFDIINDWPASFQNFDLAIASNVLEHFHNPWIVLDRMLEIAERAIVIVPYRQPSIDGYEGEGGAGHVYTFTKGSFSPYRVCDRFLFQTHGWQHQSKSERPLQLAVLIGR